jgi:four helix bundle protein
MPNTVREADLITNNKKVVMFLKLAHTKLDVFISGKDLVLSCYKISKLLPPDERFNMTQQLRRAALSIQLNIAEGSSRKSDIEKRRYYEIARGSVIEIDTILDIAEELGYFKKEDLTQTGDLIIKTFQMLSKMIVY